MSDFNETAQHLTAQFILPTSCVPGSRRRRADADEPGDTAAGAWTRLAAAGAVIAWLLSFGALGAAAPETGVTPAAASAPPGNGSTADLPDPGRGAPSIR